MIKKKKNVGNFLFSASFGLTDRVAVSREGEIDESSLTGSRDGGEITL